MLDGKVTITAADVRRVYPDPKANRSGGYTVAEYYHECKSGNYCVGEAFRRYIGLEPSLGLPHASVVAAALVIHNPRMPLVVAHDKARLIVASNDDGLFDLSWRFLDEALRWQPDMTGLDACG